MVWLYMEKCGIPYMYPLVHIFLPQHHLGGNDHGIGDLTSYLSHNSVDKCISGSVHGSNSTG